MTVMPASTQFAQHIVGDMDPNVPTIISSPVVWGKVFSELSVHMGAMQFAPLTAESHPDLAEFYRTFNDAVADVRLFSNEEISSDGGLGEAGRLRANAFLTSKHMDIQLDGPGGKDDVFAAAFGLFQGSWKIPGSKHHYDDRTPGFSLRREGNAMQFFKSDSGGITVVIRDRRGDMFFVSQTEKVDARQVAVAASVGYDPRIVFFQDQADFAGLVCPTIDVNVKPDVKYLISAAGTANNVPFRIAQALMQAKFSLHHEGYKAEVAAAAAVSRGGTPNADTKGFYVIDPKKPIAVWIARQGAHLPHFAGIFGRSAYKMPKEV